ncbi:MAG: hypothetical protein RMI30_03570 [Thermodesulfovibrio sp.]|nr:hypothetical protein [Thermodesulfovibrio sp.]MDW7998514.1 hypothetical protein [Thermodesulfovibrio sp.]
MIVKDKKHFSIGMILTAGFLGLFLLIISPIFGDGKNGLEYADDLFNKLSKGSSYFIPKLSKAIEPFKGKQFNVTVKYNSTDDAQRVAKLFMSAGANVEQQGNSLVIQGDLGNILTMIVRDSDLMYKNKGEDVRNIYGYDEKRALKDWWISLEQMSKIFKSNKLFEESKILEEVNKKAVEPAYNFYKIEAVKVSEKALIMAILLVGYVIYTIWWGYSMYHLFEGIGLTAKKPKVKKEI